MVENKIILFSNIKGGVGKSTLCAMFATYCVENDIDVIVFDADIQQTLVRKRYREQSANEEVEAPWEVSFLKTGNGTNLEETFKKLKKLPGWVLVDCPGNLQDEGLEPIFKNADAVVVPVSYEEEVVDSTNFFVDVFKKMSDADIFFVPNRINDAEGTKLEKEQREETKKVLGKLGLMTARIKQSVVIKRYSTLFAFDKYQANAVEYPFSYLVEGIRKGVCVDKTTKQYKIKEK